MVFCCASNDRELRALRNEQTWEQVLALFPDLAQARAAAEPITPVQVMSGAEDRHVAFVHDGRPIVTGVVAVGDAAMRTNPTLGRGTSIGLTHACVLRDVLREVGTEQPERLVMRFAEAGETHLMPLYRRTVIQGRSRMAEVQADIAGAPHPPPAPDWSLTRSLAALASQNASILRAYARTSFYLAANRAATKPSTVPLDEVRAVWEVNVFGALAVYQAMLPLLRASPDARVVNVTSALGSLTLAADPELPFQSNFSPVYAASKAALHAVTLAMMIETEASDIKVNLVSPGFAKTALVNFEGTDSIEDAAREILRVARLGPTGPSGTFTTWENTSIPW